MQNGSNEYYDQTELNQGWAFFKLKLADFLFFILKICLGLKIVNIDGNVEEFINLVEIQEIVELTSQNPISFINNSISSIGMYIQGYPQRIRL